VVVFLDRSCSCPGGRVSRMGRRFVGGGRSCVTHVSMGLYVACGSACVGKV